MVSKRLAMSSGTSLHLNEVDDRNFQRGIRVLKICVLLF